MITGYIINKFRGDASLFDDGIAAINRFTGWPCFGVVPWLKETSHLPAEDSVILEQAKRGEAGNMKVAVPVLGRIANFDDLDPLKMESGVELVMVRAGERLPADARLVVIPGSKSTIADLEAFRANGWADDLQAHVRRGGYVVGLCGGYQMLGRTVRDPDGIEGSTVEIQGLGLLDVETVMEPEKVVRNVSARSPGFDCMLDGYEIHLGRTTGSDTSRPLVIIDGKPDGALSPDGRIMGTYLHGLFGADAFRQRFLQALGFEGSALAYRKRLDETLDSLAAKAGQFVDTSRMAGF
jgi:adenosylcobyric acid synthase